MADYTNPADSSEGLRERGFEPRFSVGLTGSGPRVISVIKEVRALTGLGLRAAKDAVANLSVILDDQSSEQAAAAAARLERVGAAVELQITEATLYAFDPDDPRRGDQPLERARVAGLGLAFEQGWLGAWTPNAELAFADAQALLAAIDERREDIWGPAGKLEVASEHALLERVSARELELERRLRANEGETRSREAAVYGDWLQTQGDPRGLIGAAALTLDEAGDDAGRSERRVELEGLVAAHPSHLFGPARGALEAAELTWCGPVLDTLKLSEARTETVAGLVGILAAPICACLRGLELANTSDLGAGEALAASACAPGLRRLRVDNREFVLRGDRFTRLETLELSVSNEFTLGPVQLPALRELHIAVAHLNDSLAPRFAELDAPALEHFSISARPYDYWDQHFGPLQSQLFAMLKRATFARLRTLKVTMSPESIPMHIGVADLLARLPAIATLERIDLHDAVINAACRAELEQSQLPGLLLPPHPGP